MIFFKYFMFFQLLHLFIISNYDYSYPPPNTHTQKEKNNGRPFDILPNLLISYVHLLFHFLLAILCEPGLYIWSDVTITDYTEQNPHIWKQQVHFLYNFDRWLYCPQIFPNVPNFLWGRGPWATKLKFLAWTLLSLFLMHNTGPRGVKNSTNYTCKYSKINCHWCCSFICK